jgi:hypothetical protein
MFPTSKWSAEINAMVASLGFYWLVGESELRTEAVEILPGVLRHLDKQPLFTACAEQRHCLCFNNLDAMHAFTIALHRSMAPLISSHAGVDGLQDCCGSPGGCTACCVV